jgi:chorismate synthase
MAGNTFGTLFRLTSFGESHGLAVGGIIEGCPAGLKIDMDFIELEMKRRRPGQSHLTTERNEDDQVEFISGIFKGVTTGTPIGFMIRNKDQRPQDYSKMENTYRPSHADFTYQEKYGHRDHRGGGRSSARETAARVAAGAIAKLMLKHKGISIDAFVKQVGPVGTEKNYQDLDLTKTELSLIRCPDRETSDKMIALIEEVRAAGDTVGGVIQCVVQNVPIGLGEPVFDKLHAVLGHAMLSINAVKGFEIGSGFAAVNFRGSQHNDVFVKTKENEKPLTRTNNSGGIQGGISNGMPVYFNVAFKPVATIRQPQDTVDKAGQAVVLEAEGRHDPCVLPRAVPIVEAMAALVFADFLLLSNCNRL